MCIVTFIFAQQNGGTQTHFARKDKNKGKKKNSNKTLNHDKKK